MPKSPRDAARARQPADQGHLRAQSADQRCHHSLGYGEAPITAGAYPSTTVIPAEYWRHNLEHGSIVVLYKCPQGCDADFEALRQWLRE